MIREIIGIVVRGAIKKIVQEVPILRAPAAANDNNAEISPYRGTGIGFGCNLRVANGNAEAKV